MYKKWGLKSEPQKDENTGGEKYGHNILSYLLSEDNEKNRNSLHLSVQLEKVISDVNRQSCGTETCDSKRTESALSSMQK
jgi:hypothetical protein